MSITTRAICLSLLAFALTCSSAHAHAFSRPMSTDVAVNVDPNKAPSEFNHHLAGWALVGVGLLVLTSFVSPRFRWLQYVWPVLFILAGFFLAIWSDAEIWPRGNLSWGWLLHHDQEARQHKIYALLLITIGVMEYLRGIGKLSRFWRRWSFPILAVVGAGLLLIHDHTVSSGARSPEARAYLVNPALDPDGKPWSDADKSQAALTDHGAMDHGAMDHGAMHAGGSTPDSAMDHLQMSMDHSTMTMDHSATNMAAEPGHNDVSPSEKTHAHHMTPAMLLVEREHFWFMIVGIAIAAFKLISDADLARRGAALYLWPSATILLGVLLTLYHE
jgi:hypothetical protein